jgi:hypothetical protein
VLDDLEAAVRGYVAAQQAVIDAEQAVTDAKAEVPRARQRRDAAIAAAARSGARQIDIIAITGLNREQVRRIVRAAGITPDDD